MVCDEMTLDMEIKKLDRSNNILSNINLSYRGQGIQYKGYIFEFGDWSTDEILENIEDLYQEHIKILRDKKIDDILL